MSDLGKGLSLRVPISQLHSTTYAFYPDETHNTIRRVFTPRHAPYTKRHFCGFCGTHLTYWSERSKEDAEWVCISLGTLKSESRERLEDAGLLSEPEDAYVQERTENISPAREIARRSQGREILGSPWFEDLIEGSELGRIKRRRGGQSSSAGTRVEWEIIEFESGDDDGKLRETSKRKLDMVGNDGDITMRGGP